MYDRERQAQSLNKTALLLDVAEGPSNREYNLGEMLLDSLLENPAGCAFRFRGIELNREQLRLEAVELAERLHDAGVQAGEPVVIAIEHSLELPVAMCAVQAAGACAVPIDPAASVERRKSILADTKPSFVLSRATPSDKDGLIAIDIERVETASTGQDDCDPELAFIVYTSGSSGGPKGVMITQENYVRRMQNILPSISTKSDDLDIAWTPSSFITMIDELFLPLLCGVPSVIGEPQIRSDPRAFSAFIQREDITTFRITPSLLNLVLRGETQDALSKVRMVICSGEAMSAELQGLVRKKLSATLLGFYGATEAPAVGCSLFDANGPQTDRTIFTPQPFVLLRIVKDDLTEAVVGETGEIWVGGCAVARGYYRKPKLSATKFLELDGERWYRTGDLGKRLEAGEVEILGRADMSEVNINGTRVNLPEITETLQSLDNVNAAWVSPVQLQERRDPILVGHCVMEAGAEFDTQALRRALGSLLPSSAVPSVLQQIEKMPLTDNGKIDSQSLARDAAAQLAQKPGRKGSPIAESGSAATGSQDWQALIPDVLEVAEDILKTKGLVSHDSFFASGGDSLLAVEYALAIGEKFGIDIQTNLIANTENFADVARVIASGHGDAAFSARLVRDGNGDLSPLFTINASQHYEILARELAGEYKVYNLNMFGLTNEFRPVLESFSLEDLAERYADEMMVAYPSGPWRIVAFCQNGCLAVEIARILQARSDTACSLILIDTFFTEHRPTRWVQLMRLIEFGPSYYIKKISRRFKPARQKQNFEVLPIEQQMALLEKSGDDIVFYQRFTKHFMSYSPAPYDGSVSLIISSEFRHVSRASTERLAQQGLRVSIVDGLHRYIFEPGRGETGLAAAIGNEIQHLEACNL